MSSTPENAQSEPSSPRPLQSSTSQFELMLQRALQQSDPSMAFGNASQQDFNEDVVVAGAAKHVEHDAQTKPQACDNDNDDDVMQIEESNPAAQKSTHILSLSESSPAHTNAETEDMAPSSYDGMTLSDISHNLKSKNFQERREAVNGLKEKMQNGEERIDLGDDIIALLITEKNVLLQEVAVPITLSYLQLHPSQITLLTYHLKYIIQKLLASNKDNTKQAAIGLVQLAAKNNMVDQTLELLIPASKNKMPKLRIAAIHTIREILVQIGAKRLPLKNILKTLAVWFEDSEEIVRKEATELTCSIYAVVGDQIMSYIKHLRSTQLDLLKSRFEGIQGDQSQNVANEQAQQQGGIAQPAVSSSTDAVIIEPDYINVMASLPKTFEDDLASPKWLVRTGTLEKVLKLVEQEHLQPGDYSFLFTKISKVISKDKHVQVMKLAVTILGHLTKLGHSVAGEVKPNISVLLSKFKERGPGVSDVLHATLDLIERNAVPLSECRSEIASACKSKVPQVKYNTLYWIERSIEHTTGRLLGLVPALAQSFTVMSTDANQLVRDASCKAFGRLLWRVGERHVMPHVEKLDKIPQDKVKEYCGSLGENPNTFLEEEATGIPALALGGVGGDKKMKRPKTARSKSRSKSRPKSNPKERPKTAVARSSATTSALASTTKSSKITIKKASTKIPLAKVAPSISKDAALTEAENMVPDTIRAKLEDKKWKIRVEGAQEMKDYVESLGASVGSHADVFMRFLEQKPGFNDSNIHVLSLVFETLELIARNTNPFKAASAVASIPFLVEKMAQTKVKTAAFSCLMAYTQFTNPQFILSTACPVILKQKNPKIMAESLQWIQKAVENFGISLVDVSALVDFLKTCLEHTNPQVKDAASDVLVSLKACGASNVEQMIGDVKPILLSKISKRLEVTVQDKTFAPVLEVKGEVPEELVALGGNPEVQPVDISAHLTTPVKDMEASAWKTRLAAIESVHDILQQANYCITPNIVPLMRALKQLLEDSNIRVVVESLKLIDSLARSMGPAGDKYNKIILQPLVAKLSNNSKPIRSAALHSLSEWSEHMTFLPMLKYVAKVISNSKSHPEGRRGCLELIINNFQKISTRPDMVVMLTKHVIKSVTDKNPELRKLSEQLLGGMIECVGQERVLVQVQKLNLKPAILRTIHPIIHRYEKREETVPATPRGAGGGVFSAHATISTTSMQPAQIPSPTTKKSAKVTVSSPVLAQPQKRNPSVLFVPNTQKEVREAKDGGAHHWSFEPNLRKDMMLSVNHALRNSVSPLLHKQMFSDNFQAQVDAISTITENIPIYSVEIRQSIDLLYRWISVLILDCNTTLLVKSLEFIRASLELFSECASTEYEASCILPMLIEKVGHNITSVRQKIHALIKEFVSSQTVKPRRLVSFLTAGLKSKSYRSRADCLSLISLLLGERPNEESPEMVISLPHHLPQICTSIDDCEVVKSAGLQLLSHIYKAFGVHMLDSNVHLKAKHRSFVQSKFNISDSALARLSEKDEEEQMDNMEDVVDDRVHPEASPVAAEDHSTSLISEFSLDTPLEELTSAIGVFPGNNNQNERAIDALKVISELMRHNKRIFHSGTTKSVLRQLTDHITIAFHCAAERSVAHRLPKHILNCIMNLFDSKDIAGFVQKEELQAAVEQLLLLLLDNDTIGSLDDGQELNRAMNTLVIRILENANRTHVYTVLLNLLSQAAKEPGPKQNTLIEIIVKCLLKITKQLSKTIDKIDVDILLMDVDQFLNVSDSYRSTDLPLRSAKTILSELIKIKGESIRNHLTLIRASKNSPIERYIRMILSSAHTDAPSEPKRKRQRIHGPEDDYEDVNSQKLDEIFSNIRVETTCQDGLKELYQFQKVNPDISIQMWMQQCSDPFQEYIHRQLRKIELHDKEYQEKTGDSNPSTTPLDQDVYTSKFREIQKKYSVTATESSLPLFTRSRSASNSSDTAASFESIREQWKRQKRKSISASSSNLDFESLRKRFQSLPKRRSNSVSANGDSPITLEILKKRMEKTSSSGSGLVGSQHNKENVPAEEG